MQDQAMLTVFWFSPIVGFDTDTKGAGETYHLLTFQYSDRSQKSVGFSQVLDDENRSVNSKILQGLKP